MKNLTEQQRFGAATSLIGRYVRSTPQESGQTIEGRVESIRFNPDGKAVLALSSGTTLPIDQLETVEGPEEMAKRLLNQYVLAVDTRDSAQPATLEGVVTGLRFPDEGEPVLELDTGEDVRLRDIVNVRTV